MLCEAIPVYIKAMFFNAEYAKGRRGVRGNAVSIKSDLFSPQSHRGHRERLNSGKRTLTGMKGIKGMGRFPTSPAVIPDVMVPA